MTERQHVCTVMSIGAAIGAIASYLFFTQRGSAVRRQLLPAFDEFEQELNHFRATLARTAGAASEGWRMLTEAIGDTEPSPHRAANPHQTIPF